MSDAPAPPRWHTREDSGLSLDRQLAWWHDGERIEHPNIIEAFNRGVRVTDDGKYRLEFGHDWCFITVAECAFGVVAVDVSAGARLSLRLSDRTAEWLDPMTLAVSADGALTVAVKQGRARARFSRSAHVELASHLSVHGEQVVLEIDGAQWPTALALSALTDELSA
jgi:uncharacterized protein